MGFYIFGGKKYIGNTFFSSDFAVCRVKIEIFFSIKRNYDRKIFFYICKINNVMYIKCRVSCRIATEKTLNYHQMGEEMKFFSKETFAEFLGTFWLVLGGCGSAIIAGSYIGNLGVALAFGLTVFTMAYAVGHISGAHFNPAVSLGLWAAGRFEGKKLVPYIVTQMVAALCASLLIWIIQEGKAATNFDFAINGYDYYSPGQQYNCFSAFVVELVLTFFFMMVICGATDKRAPKGFAPAAIGLALTLVHLIGIPVTNLSVNPARSFGPAVAYAIALGNCDVIGQLWLFFIAPIGGAIIAGILYKKFLADDSTAVVNEEK